MSEKFKECPFCKKEVANIANCIELEDCANFEECGNSGWICVVCNANKGGCEGMERLIENIKKLMHAGNEDSVIDELLKYAPETLEDLNIIIEDELSYYADSE